MSAGETAVERTILERLDEIEAALGRLTRHIVKPGHCLSDVPRPRLLLIGWKDIASALGKSPSTLRRYVKREGLPVFRWGRHVVTSPTLIDNWLLVREQGRQKEPWKRNPSMYGGPKRNLKDMRGIQARREATALTEHLLGAA